MTGRCGLVLMVLAGCGDRDVCDPSDAPSFRITAEISAGSYDSDPVAVALGGTRRLKVAEVRPGFGGRPITSPPDHPLRVLALDDGIEIAKVEPALLTVAGRAVGASKLEVLDCDGTVLVPSFDVNVAAADRIALWPYGHFDRPPVGADVAFVAGTEQIGVALWSAGTQPMRLVDSSMQIKVPAAAPHSSEQRSWEQLYLPGIGPGVYDVDVTAAGMHVTLPLVITDHAADALEAIDPPATIAPVTPVTLCFSPRFEGRHVTGFLWTFEIDGVEDPGHGSFSCRGVHTTKTSGTLVVKASAGGQSTTVTMTVQP